MSGRVGFATSKFPIPALPPGAWGGHAPRARRAYCAILQAIEQSRRIDKIV
jgi:hypothetical protein